MAFPQLRPMFSAARDWRLLAISTLPTLVEGHDWAVPSEVGPAPRRNLPPMGQSLGAPFDFKREIELWVHQTPIA